ncbi:hypothetical protein KCU81_g1884, partial [Aureobasidium melanogenum]
MTNSGSTSGAGQASMDDVIASNSPIATTSGPPASAPPKARVSLACKRCKRRKQRVWLLDASYISALEERIAFLEARLPDHAEDHFLNDVQDHRETINDGPWNVPEADDVAQAHSPNSSPKKLMSDHMDLEQRTSLVGGVAYLSLCASGTTDSTFEPYYIGSSSGATISRVIQASIFGQAKSRATTEIASSPEQVRSEPRTPPESIHSDTASLGFPETQQARMLFDIFFERIHTRWPILDRSIYEDIFAKQYISGALSTVERSIFHLIYAITTRFLSLTRRVQSVDPEHHLAAATAPMSYILEQHSLASLQFLVLLGVHSQRSPYGAGAWSQIRYATSICIEMGLHRKRLAPRTDSEKQARDEELRRRIFWSCYCLDRATSIVLGRAFAIADRDINVELPSAGSQFWTLTHKELPSPAQGVWSNVEPFIHIIRLDRIHSRIHKVVFRVDRDVLNGTAEEQAKRDRKMATIKADLDEWLEKCPQTPKDGNKTTWMYDPESAYLDARDFYGLQYHKSVLFLFTVFLPSLQTSDPRFLICARSATSVCVAYKRLNQNKTLTYTMISLHSCFVAGLTLVYCIWRDRSLFSYEILEATRDCSQSLTIFGEKWPGAVKYRDIFDELSGNLLKSIVNRGPSLRSYDRPRQNHVNSDNVSNVSTRIQQTQQTIPQVPPNQPTSIIEMPMISDAVREAFMEVDEEAPGGWQGWRMWDEMVRENASSVNESVLGSRLAGQSYSGTSWECYDSTYNLDPVQDAVMQMGADETATDGDWNYRA